MRTGFKKGQDKSRKSGQAILFLLMVLIIGTLALLWNFDLHNMVSTKVRVVNAADAAALSAARWQAISLNMVGELNLVQAAYTCDNIAQVPTNAPGHLLFVEDIEAIRVLRSRVALTGPLMGMVAAQAAALQNLNEADEKKVEDNASAYMRKRGDEFQKAGSYYLGKVKEPYTGAWAEYGALLTSIGNNKMVVDCANADFFVFYSGYHILLDTSFYKAVAAGYPCHFCPPARRSLLESYQSFKDWGTLPALVSQTPDNCEYFGLGLMRFDSLWKYYSPTNDTGYVSLWPHVDPDDDIGRGEGYAMELSGFDPDNAVDHDELYDLFDKYTKEQEPVSNSDVAALPDAMDVWMEWHYYNQGRWMWRYPDSEGFHFEEGWGFKNEYNYYGAAAAVNCYIDAANITPNMRISTDWVQWPASAKPFGYLEHPEDSSTRLTPLHFGLVLPAFHDVRLVHNSLVYRVAGEEVGYSEHIYEHLPAYLEEGISAIEDNKCTFCRALIKWEDPEFRASLLKWLQENDEEIENGTKCRPGPSGSSMSSG